MPVSPCISLARCTRPCVGRPPSPDKFCSPAHAYSAATLGRSHAISDKMQRVPCTVVYGCTISHQFTTIKAKGLFES
uniref:Uncharacterized protein n=1 Tax=Oryza sativa subsp. japonica TaxID=39947 RepID=Q7XIJ7_ORYSJ|nr:hypothetical protein [Oryza sativa Japonica Group]